MALRSAPRLLLVVVVVVVVRESFVGASSHSLKYFSTSISEPSQGQPHYVLVGFVDGQVFVQYDSHSRKMQPRVSWMEKVGKEDPQYWDRNTQRERGNEESFRRSLENLRNRYNQSEGLHTLQWMYGCELSTDGSKRGFNLCGYNGRTFITFDTETLTWVALNPQAEITQRKWDTTPGYNQGNKVYLEEICIKWLEKYLSYQKEALQRTETPMVTMSSRTEVEDGMETHVCRVDGFYPREIDAFWTRDGEVWEEETFHTSVAPNADGTYHYWLSIQIDPKERGRYRCHVEHDGLQDPLDLELKEPKSNLGLIIGCIVTALVLMCVIAVIAVIAVFFQRRQDGYKATPNLHILQKMYGCKLCKDGSKGGFHQFGYDGRTFITFDKKTHTWVAFDPLAQTTQRKWDALPGMNQGKKANLGKICTECLKKYLSYQNEALQKTETPNVMVSSRMEVEDWMETDICRLDALYPSWKREEKVWLQDTLRGSVAPGEDGAYHYWLSNRIDPKERDYYWCHVEHEGLQDHLDLELKIVEGRMNMI